MEVVDAQLHTWLPDSPDHPWDPAYVADPARARSWDHMAAHTVRPEDLLAMMDDAGVDAAILIPPGIYGNDNSLSLEAAARWPSRFAVVGRVDPSASDLDDQLADWRKQRGMLGIRVSLLGKPAVALLEAGGYQRLMGVAERYEIPMMLFAPHGLQHVAAIARQFPQLPIVLDHLGLAQPPTMSPDPIPFQDIGRLVALAAFDNVAVKATAAPTLSSEPFPFRDLWPHLHAVIDAYGPRRVMWGTDHTRVEGMYTYQEAVGYMRDTDELSPDEKRLVLGLTLRDLLRWPAINPTPG